jgi:hypothetical protein
VPRYGVDVDDELGDVDERVAPLVIAIGRAVLGAAALEKVLLVDIARRVVERDGFEEQLRTQLERLERRPAGDLLATLRDLGIAEDLATRIHDVIQRRNRLVHRFMEEPAAVAAMQGREIAPVVETVDAIARDCQTIINELAPSAFSRVLSMFRKTPAELVEQLRGPDPTALGDPALRRQLEVICALCDEDVQETFGGAPTVG